LCKVFSCVCVCACFVYCYLLGSTRLGLNPKDVSKASIARSGCSNASALVMYLLILYVVRASLCNSDAHNRAKSMREWHFSIASMYEDDENTGLTTLVAEVLTIPFGD